MIKSMTGYGKQTITNGPRSFVIEIKTLNSRFLDFNLKIPPLYRNREIELRNIISNLLKRGKVDMQIELTGFEAGSPGIINKKLFGAYANELNALAEEYGLPKTEILRAILSIPEVVTAVETKTHENEWKLIVAGLESTLKSVDDFRLQEGKELQKDIVGRLQEIERSNLQLESMEVNRKEYIRKRIVEGLNELKNAMADENRLEQEMIFYLEKLDISEEITRLKSHCSYFREVIDEPGDEKGKKLSFISQELGREINTIGSKANDAEIQKVVVNMKEQLEKIKEQTNNIL